MASAETKRNAPWYVKAFVLLHVICITVWATPPPRPDLLSGKVDPPVTAVGDWVRVLNAKYLKTNPVIDDYIYITSAWQYWDMFAPNPAQRDWWGDARVQFQDGTEKTYAYPRMFSLPLQNKYAQERYRKYYERIEQDKNAFMWPPYAMHIAHLMDDPKNPPVKVKLVRHWLDIAPPGKPQAQQYSSETFFEYIVDQRQLARMRKMWP